jgi:hypothetical protein
MSLKKAVMSVQGDYKDKFISVEYVSKKGKQISQSVEIPMGRKIRQSLIIEKKVKTPPKKKKKNKKRKTQIHS